MLVMYRTKHEISLQCVTGAMVNEIFVYHQDLVPDVSENGETTDTIADLVDEELAATALAVEEASLRIQNMLKKSREDDTGVKLEVNERLLDSCTGLMKAIKILITRSKELQSEIVAEGMVSFWEL